MKSGRSGVSCKTSKCSDAGAGDLGVPPTHETSPRLGDEELNSPRVNAAASTSKSDMHKACIHGKVKKRKR